MENETNDEFKFELENLRKLQDDIEKQLLQFDEIIPYERQTTAKIFSPRLLNLMLSCCPQIEAVTKLLCNRCEIPLNELGENGRQKPISVPKLISKINAKAVLSGLEIQTISDQLMFTPFTLHLEWWQKYANLKHGLAKKQYDITYTDIMNAFSALAVLHYVTYHAIISFNETIPFLLDRKYWMLPSLPALRKDDLGRYYQKTAYGWKSKIFGIRNFFEPPGLGTPTHL